ncbi:MAG: 4Fe-4S binding protein, partial [Lacisediminimonas sp.]|nr:4Fe-4S binding protein [Lacisediminimonas sp.]
MNADPEVSVIKMYAAREEIYPREIQGRYATLRWVCVWLTQLVFYGLPWFTWNDRQAVLFDLAARKFYILGIVLWPQDFIYLAALLIICAYLLFLATAVAGRVWCGFACPQTVYTEIFMWIERKIEGSRSARMRLDRQPASAAKFAKKSAKHLAWGAVALWTGITFVGYFTPIRTLMTEIATLGLGPWEWFWVLFYSFATYGNAGWMREQVCKYMCPYARFQSSMFDNDTLIITYDEARGEPRGARNKNTAGKALG